MKLKMRKYQDETDYWRIRQFLRSTYPLNKHRTLNWHVAQLDYWRWHILLNCREITALDDLIYIWETDRQEIAAVLNLEKPNQAFLQIHPAHKSFQLEDEMIMQAEEILRGSDHQSDPVMEMWSNVDDTVRNDLLTKHGFTPGKWVESQWWRDLTAPISPVKLPDGYQIRSLGDNHEIPARSWASWRGFHPESPDEDYEGWEWYRNIQRCPLYRRDLDLVAEAPTGEIASFCTIWFDDVTRSAYIEPVATVPEHLRKGLARATITAGLNRVQKMGCTRAFVSGFEAGPNALYSATLSPQHDTFQHWIKKL